MYHLAKEHFKKADPILSAAAEKHAIANIRRSSDVFRDIVRAIAGQQLSGKAAATIFGRLETLVGKKTFTPEKILELTGIQLRTCGLSGAKTSTIQGVARSIIEGKFNPKILHKSSDEEIIATLRSIKGIGPWTAEMILMFSLGRTDIFSKGDLGLRKGIMKLYGLKKMPSDRKMDELAKAWSPYRTYAARVLWRVADEAKKD